jgi:hypothetical protein
MSILLVLGAVFVVLVILALVRLRRRSPFRLREVGTLIDRAVGAYRRNLVPLLLLSMLCLPLGSTAGALSLRPALFGWFTPISSGLSSDLLWNVLVAMSVLGVLGIGHTLLACGAAQVLEHDAAGVRPTLRDALPRRRIGAMLGLALLLIAPSLLGSLFGIFGALFALLWALAPAALVVEGSKPWAAMRRSVGLARRNYSLLLNTLVPLWIIGWLVGGTPLLGSLWVVGLLELVPSSAMPALTFAALLLGGVFVAPLTALGNAVVYRTLREELPTP